MAARCFEGNETMKSWRERWLGTMPVHVFARDASPVVVAPLKDSCMRLYERQDPVTGPRDWHPSRKSQSIPGGLVATLIAASRTSSAARPSALEARGEDVGGPQAEGFRHVQAVVELAHVGVPAIGAEAELDPGRPGELQKTQLGELVAGADLDRDAELERRVQHLLDAPLGPERLVLRGSTGREARRHWPGCRTARWP